MTSFDSAKFLSYFTGKGAARAADALVILTAAVERGYWESGESRAARAALTKANVASRVARDYERSIEDHYVSVRLVDGKYLDYGPVFCDREPHPWRLRLVTFHVSHALTFGQCRLEPADIDTLIKQLSDVPVARGFLHYARAYAAVATPIFKLLDKLDAARPRPKFTQLGVSPLITHTLALMGLADSVCATVRMPEVVFETVQVREKGALRDHHVMRLVWPEGTVFNASQHAHKASNCHACGHAIRNPFNWVPVLVDNAAGVPHAMWVGRDCAESVFGIVAKGELEYQNR